jgi:hypothetical protein
MYNSFLRTLFYSSIAALGIWCLFLTGCDIDQTEIVDQKVSTIVHDFRKKRNTECRDALLLDAEHIVDSMLLAEAQTALRDSLSRGKPGKPTQPPAVLPIDSLLVQPIFKK